jgi:hypothetical protein
MFFLLVDVYRHYQHFAENVNRKWSDMRCPEERIRFFAGRGENKKRGVRRNKEGVVIVIIPYRYVKYGFATKSLKFMASSYRVQTVQINRSIDIMCLG